MASPATQSDGSNAPSPFASALWNATAPLEAVVVIRIGGRLFEHGC